MKIRMMFLAAVVAGLVVVASPQVGWAAPDHGDHWQDRDHGNKHSDSREAYEDGYRDGGRDREKHQKWHPRGNQWKGDAHEAYEAGYRAAFNGNRRDWHDDDRDRVDNRREEHPVFDQVLKPDQGRDAGRNNLAYRNGYADGLSYGRHDRDARKAYKPTDSNAYEKANNGYNSRFGTLDDYKRDYRAGYRDGYQRGYNR